MAIIATTVLILPGCDRKADEAASDAQASDAASIDASDVNDATAADSAADRAKVDHLLSLPYAGWVEDDEETGEALIHFDEQRSHPGYTLFTVFQRGKAVLIDHKGRVVHTWQADNAIRWDRTELLPNGDILTTGADRLAAIVDSAPPNEEPETQWYALRLTWSGETVWKKRLQAHHHIRPTPDDRLVVLTFSRRAAPAVHPTTPIRDNDITILSPDGEVLDSLSLYDATTAKPKLFPLIRRPPQVMYNPRELADGDQKWVDLFHSNSIEWMYQPHLFDKHPIYGPDNVLWCCRNQNRIAIFDMKRKELVWTWGARQLSGPHDAQVLPNGNIMLFDNGVSRGWSRVIELDPLTERIVWEFKAPQPTDFYSRGRGSAQRFANGNTLIANAAHGEVFEITPEGNVVWRYLYPERNEKGKRATINHAERYATEFIDGLIAKYGANGAQPTSRP